MAKELSHNIKSMIGVSAMVEIKAPNQVPRSQGKAQRVVELRQR
jgi:phenylacetate-CoA ligase